MRRAPYLFCLSLVMPLLSAPCAMADDPNQGGAPMYCRDGNPYLHDDPHWESWMADCYGVYDHLPAAKDSAACEQSWQDQSGGFAVMKHDEFMHICSNPWPY